LSAPELCTLNAHTLQSTNYAKTPYDLLIELETEIVRNFAVNLLGRVIEPRWFLALKWAKY
jgi:hypothetical protein